MRASIAATAVHTAARTKWVAFGVKQWGDAGASAAHPAAHGR
jgi:hypothetical protein